jgi:type IV pilus assembly protein PilM
MCAWLGGNRKTPVIGVDLGSGFIKMAQFKEEQNQLKLVNFGVLSVPEGAIVEGRIEKTRELAEILKELISFHSFIGNRIVANVSGQLVVVKEIIIDALPENELDEAIKWEIEKFLPFPLDKAVFDYQILNEVLEGGKVKKLNILVAAAPLEVVELTAELFKLANLEPVALEVEPFSVLRLLRFDPDFSFENEILFPIINIGYNYTSINMVDKGMVRFSRTIPTGGRKITDSIASTLGKSFEEAEEIKVKELDLTKESPLTKATITLFEGLALELKRSINFYFNKFNDGKTIETAILLEGGSANIKGIERFIESTVGFPTEVNRLFNNIATFDPNLFTKEYLYEMAPMFSVATGLALRGHALKVTTRKKISQEQTKGVLTYKKG